MNWVRPRLAGFGLGFAVTVVLLGSLPGARAADSSPDTLPDEVSIKEDRKSVEDMRKDIPDTKKRDNDELAALLAMIPGSDQEPSEIRSRFSTLVSKKREAMDKILRDKRDAFSSEERKSREVALKKLTDERTTYLKDKHTNDERGEFFGKQEDLRRSVFAKQDEKRKSFESDVQDERKRFDDYMRERTSRFNDIARDYTSRYYERKKNLDLKKRMEEKARDKERDKANSSTRDSSSGGYANSYGAGYGPTDAFGALPASSSSPYIPRGKTAEEEAMLKEFRALPPTPVVPLGAGDSK